MRGAAVKVLCVDGPAAGELIEAEPGGQAAVWAGPASLPPALLAASDEARPDVGMAWTQVDYWVGTVRLFGRRVHVATVRPAGPDPGDLFLHLVAPVAMMAADDTPARRGGPG